MAAVYLKKRIDIESHDMKIRDHLYLMQMISNSYSTISLDTTKEAWWLQLISFFLQFLEHKWLDQHEMWIWDEEELSDCVLSVHQNQNNQ